LFTGEKEHSISHAPEEMLAPLTDKKQAGQIVLNGADISIYVSSELAKSGIIFSPFSKLSKEGMVNP
jgi:hypothetical protein